MVSFRPGQLEYRALAAEVAETQPPSTVAGASQLPTLVRLPCQVPFQERAKWCLEEVDGIVGYEGVEGGRHRWRVAWLDLWEVVKSLGVVSRSLRMGFS